MTDLIDWLYKHFPNQPMRIALMLRILNGAKR